jgi:hypothetical protein
MLTKKVFSKNVESQTTMGEMSISRTKGLKRFAIGITIAGLLMTNVLGTAMGYTFADDDVTGLNGKTSRELQQESIEAQKKTHLYNPAYALSTGLDPNETEAEREERLARNKAMQIESPGITNPDFRNSKPPQQETSLRPLSERIFVHQKRVQFDVPPVIENGRTLVPIRMVAQELGAEVEWLNETQEVIITKDGKRIVLTLGSKNVTVDGVKSTIDVPAKAVDGRTLVPIRFISENMSIPVEYIETSQEVHIG